MNTSTVKPANLLPNDKITAETYGNGETFKRSATVIRIDKVDPGYVRVITRRKGRIDGKLVVDDFQDMFHPNHDLVVERAID